MIKTILKKIRGSEFLANTLILLSGTTIAQMLPFIFSPIISRLFTAEDFSVYGVFISIYSIFGVLLALRYDMSIMMPKKDEDAKQLVMLSFILSLIISSLIMISLLLFGENISVLLNIQALNKWILLLPVSALFLSINNILINWFNRKKEYKTIAFNRVQRNASITGANLGFGALKIDSGGLIISQLISDAIAAFYYLWNFYKKELKGKKKFDKKASLALAKQEKDFPLFTLPTNFIDTFSMQLPILLITAYFSTQQSGSYFFAYRILGLPMSMIGAAYAQTFFQKFVSIIKEEDYKAAKTFLGKSWALLFSIIIVPAIVVALFGPWLFSFIFGQEWLESGKIASILIFYITFAFISSPTSSTYIALKMQKYSLIFGIASLTYRFLSFYLGYIFKDFYFAIAMLVICEIVEIIIYNTVVIIKLNRMTKQKEVHLTT